MKIKQLLLLILVLCISNSVFAKGGHKISRPVTESISIDESDEGKDRLVFNFEQDSYSYNATQYGNPSITYSTNGWDFGITSQNINEYSGNLPQAQNFENDSYININKTFKHSDTLDNLNCGDICDDLSVFLSGKSSTTIGTQTGMVFPMSNSIQPNKITSNTIHEFYFLDNDVEIIKDVLSYHVGSYYANKALTTTTSYFGMMYGTEIIFIPRRLKFNLDYFDGRSNVSGTVIQGTLMFDKHFEIFSGIGLATAGSGNYNYVLFGVNLIEIFNK